MTRRTWIAATAAALGSGVVNAAGNRAPLGAELYTVRNLLPKDPEGTLRRIAEIGYRNVESGRAELANLEPLLKKYKLATPSVMIETPLVTGSWGVWKESDPKVQQIGWSEALDSTRALGARFAVVGYLMPSERGKDAEDHKRLADAMNAAGERCRAAGLRFCYHHHAFEFQDRGGERLIHVLLERTDPKLVWFETDVFWLASAGHDPVEFLKHHGNRIAIVHLKDRRPGTPVEYNDGLVKPPVFMEVGSGSLDFPAIIKAGADAGVEYYIVEQDHTPGNPLDSLKKSFDYLRGLRSPALQIG